MFFSLTEFQAIHYSDSHRRTRPDLATIMDATRGIVFLGTPHRGSDATTLPKMIASVIAAFQDVNVNLLQALERESETLDRIGDSFGQILDRRTFSVYSFEEELAIVGRKVSIVYMWIAVELNLSSDRWLKEDQQ